MNILFAALLVCLPVIAAGCLKTAANENGVDVENLSGECPLTIMFQDIMKTPLQSDLAEYFSGAQCTQAKKVNIDGKEFQSLKCNVANGLVLLHPRYLQTTGKTDFELKMPLAAKKRDDVEEDSQYKGMAIDIEGSVLEWGAIKAAKKSGSEDFVLESSASFTLNSAKFLQSHFSLALSDLQVAFGPPGQALNKIPAQINNAKLSTIFKPNKYFEMVISDPDQKKNFVAQNFPENLQPAVAFYALPFPGESPLSLVNKVLGTKLESRFATFLDLPDVVFSASTSDIGVIMDDSHRDVLKVYGTEATRNILPRGKQLRWLMGDLKKVKVSADNVPQVEEVAEVKTTKTLKKVATVVQKTKGNEGAAKEAVTTKKKQKTKKIAKREEAENKYSKNIAVELTFPKEGGKIEIKVSDYLKGEFYNLVATFFPHTDMLTSSPKAASVNLDGKEVDITLTDKTCVFTNIILDAASKEIVVFGTVLDDWWIGGQMANLKGMNLTATATFPENGAPRGKWKLGGQGEIKLFNKLVTIQIQDVDDEYTFTGDFQVTNMSQILKTTNNPSFMTEEDLAVFTNPQELAFIKLSFDTPVLEENALKVVADSHLYVSESDLDEETVSSEILFQSTDEGELSMTVLLCGENINYKNTMKALFNITVQGVTWINFQDFCLLFTSEKLDDNDKEFFKHPLIDEVPTEAGIQMIGKLKQPTICTIKGQESDEINSKDELCMMIKSNPHFINHVGLVKGTIHATDHSLEGIGTSPGSHALSEGSPLLMSEIKIQLIELRGKNKEEEEDVNKFKVQTHNASLIVSAQFTSVVNDQLDTLAFRGEISPYSSGEIELIVSTDIKWTPPEGDSTAFKWGKVHSAHATLKDHHFNNFFVKAEIIVGTDPDRLLTFKYRPRTQINLSDKQDLLVIAHKKANQNTIDQLFQAFGKKYEHVFLNNMKSIGRTSVVYSRKDQKIEELGRDAKTGLNFFGQVKDSSETRLYKLRIYPDGNFKFWMDLKLLNVSNGNFLFKRKKSMPTSGPRLVARSTVGSERNVVTMKGQIETIGVITEDNVVATVAPLNGAFTLNMPPSIKFFGEAPAVIKIREPGVRGRFSPNDINPYLRVDLMPGKEYIERETNGYLKYLANKISNIISKKKMDNLKVWVQKEAGAERVKLLDAMQSISQEIQEQVEELKSSESIFSSDCLTECNSKGTVRIPGLRFDESSQKMVFNPSMYETADVACIANCEAEKSSSAAGYSLRIEATKNMLEKFDELTERIRFYEMAYETYDCAFKSDAHTTAQLEALLQKTIKLKALVSRETPNFELMSLMFVDKVGNVDLKGEKCVPDFKAVYKVNREEYQFAYTQCFNGEYGFYFAQKLAENYLGSEMGIYHQIIKKNDAFVSILQSQKSIVMRSIRIVLQEGTEEERALLKEKVDQLTAELKDFCANIGLSTDEKKSKIPKMRKANKVVFGEEVYTIPYVRRNVRHLLRSLNTCTTRSLRTRQAFLYSSPWAAINNFNPEHSIKSAKLHLRHFNANLTRCGYTKSIISQYKDIYQTVNSISKTYLKSRQKIEQVTKKLTDKLVKRRSQINRREDLTDRAQNEDVEYWFKQVEEGMKLFEKRANEKLKSHSENALRNVKVKYDSSVKEMGHSNIASFVSQLNKNLALSFKRASLPSTPASVSAARLSSAFSQLFNNPRATLEEVSLLTGKMEKYVNNVDRLKCK